ncbi:hypothetical protein [Cryobacterium sp. GrIS_2_6]|uniref:hypothetical protein n=1 Tax=Cryobacterium sp. GrIS_2_6 TaxID=3162785 RepID=UPI002E05BA3F|nr:hypothetical protein [Cryobacterium psychrotolerans]
MTAALDRLYAETRTDPFVANVDSFSGVADRQRWADRQYQLAVAQNPTLANAQLLEVETVAIEPALRVNDWAGAGQ